MIFELPDGGQAIDGVTCKTRDRFGDDEVYLSGQSIFNHAFEAFAAFGVGTGDAFIGVEFDEFPVITRLDVVRVIGNLRLVARELLIGISRDTSIGSDSAFLLAVERRFGGWLGQCMRRAATPTARTAHRKVQTKTYGGFHLKV